MLARLALWLADVAADAAAATTAKARPTRKHADSLATREAVR